MFPSFTEIMDMVYRLELGVSPTYNTSTGKDPRDLATLVESREIPNGRGDTYVIWSHAQPLSRMHPTEASTRENAGAEHPSIAFGDQRLAVDGLFLAHYVWRHMKIETRPCAKYVLTKPWSFESEIEKVSGEIESLLGELGHLSDVSDRESLTPSPRTNMVVQRQQEQQDFCRKPTKKTSPRPDFNRAKTSATFDNGFLNKNQLWLIAQLDQQVINRPQTQQQSSTRYNISLK
ncbi:Hypothetical predicted protein [Mytilus galloprovincialis]|uniref:Uncharacterized protein n=1 Tax=Mytilus galloprovincialis TaxID=29158 RepID=A0A8B6F0Y7_MYTGA|nr:Hypothetical predicted protein [Mytilus galloprovincialis]